MKSRTLALTIGAAIAVLLLALAGTAAWLFRVEEIPEELEALDATTDPRDLVLAGVGDTPDLVLADLAGQTTFFFVEGPQSFRSREGQTLARALNRWVYPENTAGYIIGDLSALALFRSKIEETVGLFAEEMRFPVRVDFEGKFLEVLKLPVGHTAFVVMTPDGEVAIRHSGKPTPEEIEKFREVLGATEPPPGPPAPEFSAGSLTRETCAGKTCVLAFLGVALDRSDIPGIEGGREIEEEQEAMDAMKQPELRLVSTLARFELPEDVPGVLVGELTHMDEEMAGWERVASTPQLRAAFELEEGQTAFFIIDPEGRVAFAERDAFPLYRTGRVAELLGVKMKRDGEDEDGDEDDEDAPPS